MLALAELGRLHGPLLGDAAMAHTEWLNRDSPMNQALIGRLYAGFADRYREQITARHREVCERLVGSVAATLSTTEAGPACPSA